MLDVMLPKRMGLTSCVVRAEKSNVLLLTARRGAGWVTGEQAAAGPDQAFCGAARSRRRCRQEGDVVLTGISFGDLKLVIRFIRCNAAQRAIRLGLEDLW